MNSFVQFFIQGCYLRAGPKREEASYEKYRQKYIYGTLTKLFLLILVLRNFSVTYKSFFIYIDIEI